MAYTVPYIDGHLPVFPRGLCGGQQRFLPACGSTEVLQKVQLPINHMLVINENTL